MKASYKRHILHFKRPSGTSRGILKTKETWFVILEDKGKMGFGECGILRTLSVDDVPHYEQTLKWVCDHIHDGLAELLKALKAFPSIQFGLEQAFLSLSSKTPFELFPSPFTRGKDSMVINGLVWMGNEEFMKHQIIAKINSGFTCIKMKIGAIDFETEFKLLQYIRKEFSQDDITLRVDANGAFSPDDAMRKLQRLATLDLHSIEQPIKQGHWDHMAKLCEQTPLPIALDEELIGVYDVTNKEKLLQTIQPQFIILKPSLIGGYSGSESWISCAEKHGINYWVTSALESNIGLNAISQWTYTLGSDLPQGLGTGSLFTNNITSPLEVINGTIRYNSNLEWDFNI
jgi:o-succinylbenzoate synthase